MEYNLQHGKFRNLIIVIALLIISLPVILFLIVGSIGIEIFAVITTSLLTLALVVLYFQQFEILDKQTELMHRDYQSALVKRGKVVADEDDVRIKLKNAGRGKVRNLFLKCEVTSDTGNVEVNHGRIPMKSVRDGIREVPPESDWEHYKAEVRFRIPSIDTTDDERGFPFKMLAKQLSHEGIDTVELKLTIEVIDEGIMDDAFSYSKVIAEQVIDIPGPVTQEIGGDEVTRHVSTSLEDTLGSKYSSKQDICAISLEELAEKQSHITVK